jgi:hypothetical protein
VLEETVLGSLRERLMDPGLFSAFVVEFTAAWNRLQAEASAGLIPTARLSDLRPAQPAEAANAARRLCGEPSARSARPALEGTKNAYQRRRNLITSQDFGPLV